MVLADNIAKQLAEGHKANITVKGFASPLAQNDYNINLTKRRISSIRNFLANHDGGKLKGMMDKISITEQANGEDSAASGLNDDEKNTKLSIYDLAPSKERRVEIVDVRFVKE
jgi:outer membrane protein OmpA-like peptidoglycan-associated protein